MLGRQRMYSAARSAFWDFASCVLRRTTTVLPMSKPSELKFAQPNPTTQPQKQSIRHSREVH